MVLLLVLRGIRKMDDFTFYQMDKLKAVYNMLNELIITRFDTDKDTKAVSDIIAKLLNKWTILREKYNAGKEK